MTTEFAEIGVFLIRFLEDFLNDWNVLNGLNRR
jgi:hypothetical protein